MTLRELRDLMQTTPAEWLDSEIYATSNLAFKKSGSTEYMGFVDLVDGKFTYLNLDKPYYA